MHEHSFSTLHQSAQNMIAPRLSIVVIFHNMRREAKRTLLSLSTAYQRGVSADDYEVIAIDNGSDQPLDPAMVEGFGPQFHYVFHDTASISPAEAINLGGKSARGRYIALIVDGARMATPGLLCATLKAMQLSKTPFLCSLSWHLGPDVQNNSILKGYNQQVEDQLLNSIDWPEDGYRLFDISALAQSSHPGFLSGFPRECSWACVPQALFAQLGGYEMAFQGAGGGLVNHDFVNRAAKEQGVDFTVILGEGVFHQFHGGVATNVKLDDHPISDFQQEYKAIRGQEYQRADIREVVYSGTIPRAAKRFLAV